MIELDGDDVRVSSRGKYAERDIVQVRNLIKIIYFVHCEEPVSVLIYKKQLKLKLRVSDSV